MRKGIVMTVAALMLSAAFAFPTFANNYDFSSGTEQTGVFGKATSSDNLVTAEMLSDNTRRNKDAAALPAPYGYFSGDIPTDPSSLYHDNPQQAPPCFPAAFATPRNIFVELCKFSFCTIYFVPTRCYN